MGNCCGKEESDDDAFARPGRVLGSSSDQADTTPSARPTAATPTKKVGGPPRTLGGGQSVGGGPSSTATQGTAVSRAGQAAEIRAKAATKGGGGKLQSQLAAQKKQTRNDVLKDASNDAVRTREVEAAAQARNWD